MGVVATDDLEYLARATGDAYHQSRADDGLAWLMNTMELYPDVVGYGRYGGALGTHLPERRPARGGLLRRQLPLAAPGGSYNAWAAGSAMEALRRRSALQRPSPPRSARR
jgi:hypothetical protein